MFAQIAQLVEQGTENPRVLGSIPSLGTIFFCFFDWALGEASKGIKMMICVPARYSSRASSGGSH